MKKPVYKNWWFILGAFLIVGVISGIGHNIAGTTPTSNKETKSELSKAEDKKEQPTKEEVKEWNPKEVAEFNSPYVANNGKNADGSNPVINVSKVEKKDNNSIVVTIGAPSINDVQYAVNKFLSVNPRDKKGDSISIKNISTNISGDNTELIIAGEDFTNVSYLEIGPYKTKDNNVITFEVK